MKDLSISNNTNFTQEIELLQLMIKRGYEYLNKSQYAMFSYTIISPMIAYRSNKYRREELIEYITKGIHPKHNTIKKAVEILTK